MGKVGQLPMFGPGEGSRSQLVDRGPFSIRVCKQEAWIIRQVPNRLCSLTLGVKDFPELHLGIAPTPLDSLC